MQYATASKLGSDVADIDFQLQVSDKQSVNRGRFRRRRHQASISIASTPQNILLFRQGFPDGLGQDPLTHFNRRGQDDGSGYRPQSVPAVLSTDGAYGTFDLQSVLTNEIGHLLGVGCGTSVPWLDNAQQPREERGHHSGRISFASLASPTRRRPATYTGPADILDDRRAVVSGKLYVGQRLACRKTFARLGGRYFFWTRCRASGSSALDGTFRMGGGSPRGSYRIFARATRECCDRGYRYTSSSHRLTKRNSEDARGRGRQALARDDRHSRKAERSRSRRLAECAARSSWAERRSRRAMFLSRSTHPS